MHGSPPHTPRDAFHAGEGFAEVARNPLQELSFFGTTQARQKFSAFCMAVMNFLPLLFHFTRQTA